MPDYSGQSIGRYHVIEPLGQGGMATVYRAYDTRLECDVAVKFIRMERLTPEEKEKALKRFEREAKELARLTHPNIVKVTDFGKYKGTPYLVMEYLPGGTLKQLAGKPLSYDQVSRLLAQVAKALETAHKKNLIHRDIKPSNILLTEEGQPMVSDFGIAKILDVEGGSSLTSTNAAVGTPEYMAPEQWFNKISIQTDIYALGIVFYELVTGQRPYTADTPAAVFLKQSNDPLPRPRSFVPGLPEEVEKVLFKALAKKPEDRYASMGEFAAAMEELSSLPKAAPQPRPQVFEVVQAAPEPPTIANPPSEPQAKESEEPQPETPAPSVSATPLQAEIIEKPETPREAPVSVPPVAPEAVAFEEPHPETPPALLVSATLLQAEIFEKPETPPEASVSALPAEPDAWEIEEPHLETPAPSIPLVPQMPEISTPLVTAGPAREPDVIGAAQFSAEMLEPLAAPTPLPVEVFPTEELRAEMPASPEPAGEPPSATQAEPAGAVPPVKVGEEIIPVSLTSLMRPGASRRPGAKWLRVVLPALLGIVIIGLAAVGISQGRQGIGPLAFMATESSTATLAPPLTPVAIATSAPVEAAVPTSTTIPTKAATPTNTTIPANTPLPASTSTPAPTPVPPLGIGSTQVSPKDRMVQVYVPDGDFLMGSDKTKDSQANDNELPQHTVYLDAYWIDQTEVTNAQYARCVADGQCTPPDNTGSATHPSYYFDDQYANYPIIFVNWNQALAYCSWAGRRLPSEAEWEKAARGTDGQIYPWGNAAPDPSKLNGGVDGKGDTNAVGSYPAGASPYGVLDMAGNVWEWVNDWYSASYYQQSPAHNPTGPATGIYHVLRGGSWSDNGGFARSANRIRYYPIDYYALIGFRCAASPAP